MFRRRRLACSFCGKGEADVMKLVAGPKVFICDRCVDIAGEIMKRESGDQPGLPEADKGVLRRVLNRIGLGRHSGTHRCSENEAITL